MDSTKIALSVIEFFFNKDLLGRIIFNPHKDFCEFGLLKRNLNEDDDVLHTVLFHMHEDYLIDYDIRKTIKLRPEGIQFFISKQNRYFK